MKLCEAVKKVDFKNISEVVDVFCKAIDNNEVIYAAGKADPLAGCGALSDMIPDGSNLRILNREDGLQVAAAWTEEPEGIEYFKTPLKLFLQMLVSGTGLDGVIIDPQDAACFLPKALIQRIIEPCVFDIDEQPDNILVNQAIHFAVTKHANQNRKGTDIPYITHPMAAMQILADMNADKNLLMAGILHDTVEDTETDLMEITNVFGPDVAMLVNCHSENKKRTWDQRKASALEEARLASHRLQMLILADKLSNLRCTNLDYKTMGEKFWSRFSQGMEPQKKSYNAMREALADLANHEDSRREYKEFADLCDKIFNTEPKGE